ncbi:MAG: transcriptional regulator, AraC family [Polyangiaceae bacterium]|jgi:AraC-like DNA-binding protein|nr:transcriptional regulator, AraC family [Polyangiaceae bacterium]
MDRGPIFQEYERSVSPAGYVSFYAPSSTRPAHFHGQLEVLVVTRGQLTCSVGAVDYVVNAPALVWHLPTISHQTIKASRDCFFWVVLFEPFLVEEVLCSAEVARADGPLASLGTSASLLRRVGSAGSPFAGWILRLTNLFGARPVVEITQSAASALEELAAQGLQRLTCEQVTSALRELLVLAVAESERQLSRLGAASLPELGIALLLAAPELERPAVCQQLQVSTSYLSRQFQRRVGTTFAACRSRARVASFLAASEQGATSLLQAALASGFGSYSQAHRVFSKVTGYCPRCYLQGAGRAALSEVTVSTL